VIIDHARLLAREVITRACESYASGAIPGDFGYIRDVVIHARWPIRGRGQVAMANARTQREVRAAIADQWPALGRSGVSMANARTQREVRAAIAEFYQPAEPQEKNT